MRTDVVPEKKPTMKTNASPLKPVCFALSAVFSLSVLIAPAQICPAPGTLPTGSTSATQDRDQMMCQLGLTYPALPSKLVDPNRPPSGFPKSAGAPEGDWQNFYGHTITRSAWGLWNNYEDTIDGFLDPDGFNGWDKHTVNDPDSWRVFDDAGAQHAKGAYTPIDLLKMDDGTPVATPSDWWTKRRGEILTDLQEELYGKIPDRSLWPAITWTLGAVTTGNANGVAYRQRTITGNMDAAAYYVSRGFPPSPPLRNTPSISATLRIPQAAFDASNKVPVIITYGSGQWSFVAAKGWGTIGFNQGAVQGGGGAAMSSYIIGMINGGNWRKPDDMGTLAAWAWGVGRLIDYLETNVTFNPGVNDLVANVDVKRLGIEGHSFLGKATLVAMAYEPRLAIAYPSRGGSGGTKMNRRHWGQDLENSLGNDAEYYWYAGNVLKYCGPLFGSGTGTISNATDIPASGPYPGNNAATWRTLHSDAGTNTDPGTYLPRKLELLKVDAHSLVALCAPRPVFLNGGTHDSWTDQRGQWLTQVAATPVYKLLGKRGMVDRSSWPFDADPSTPAFDAYVPNDPVTRHTKVIRNFDGYILGDLGYRYSGESLHTGVAGESPGGGGHTDAEDFPTFVQFASKFLDPAVAPPSLPSVYVNSSGADLIISWPDYATNAYTLQRATSLTANDWADCSTTSNAFVISPAADSEYFRLKHQ
jgi:hypothetical protein